MTQWFPWLPPFHLPATFLTFHKVFLLLLYFLHERWPDRATSRGSHGLRRAIMVGRAAMWCGTVQIITRPAVYFHLSSLATTPASSGPRREARLIERRPPIEVNWCNVWMILLVCMCVCMLVCTLPSFFFTKTFSTLKTKDCFLSDWLKGWVLFQVAVAQGFMYFGK